MLYLDSVLQDVTKPSKNIQPPGHLVEGFSHSTKPSKGRVIRTQCKIPSVEVGSKMFALMARQGLLSSDTAGFIRWGQVLVEVGDDLLFTLLYL